MKHILVTGCNGQLGREIQDLANQFSTIDFYFTDIAELDITNLDAIRKFVTNRPLDCIINCAAYTAVDKAEADVDLCARINTDAVSNLAQVAHEEGARMIHVSTDYVYGGESHKPYNETDPTAPISVYGMTKLQGEDSMFALCPDSIVLRTSWLYSPYGNNFVKTMIRLGQERPSLGVIFDQIGTPTYAHDLAKVILFIVSSDRFVPGIYNYSNEGVCSWYDFAVTIHRLSNITDCEINPIETSDYPTAAKRPFYSVMNKKKIKETYDVSIPHWEKSLRDCLKRLK